MATNKARSEDQKKAEKEYFDNLIDTDMLDEYDDLSTEDRQNKWQAFKAVFNVEFYNWRRKQQGNFQKVLAEYLSGLPSVVFVDFAYCDIIKQGVRFGYLTEGCDERKEVKFCKNWFNYPAKGLLKAARKEGINLLA